jgi:hypothetical protein
MTQKRNLEDSGGSKQGSIQHGDGAPDIGEAANKGYAGTRSVEPEGDISISGFKEGPVSARELNKQPRISAMGRRSQSLIGQRTSTLLPNGEDARPKAFLDSRRNHNRPLLPPRYPTPPADSRLMWGSNYVKDAFVLGAPVMTATSALQESKGDFKLNPKALALLTIAAEFALIEFSNTLVTTHTLPPLSTVVEGHSALVSPDAGPPSHPSTQPSASLAQPAISLSAHSASQATVNQPLLQSLTTTSYDARAHHLTPQHTPSHSLSLHLQQQKQMQQSMGAYEHAPAAVKSALAAPSTAGTAAAYSSTGNFTVTAPSVLLQSSLVPWAQRSELILDSEARHLFTPTGWRTPSAKPIHLLRKKKGFGAGHDTRDMAIGSIMARTSMMYGASGATNHNKALLHSNVSRPKPPSPSKPSLEAVMESISTFSSLLQQPDTDNGAQFSGANSIAN